MAAKPGALVGIARFSANSCRSAANPKRKRRRAAALHVPFPREKSNHAVESVAKRAENPGPTAMNATRLTPCLMFVALLTAGIG